MEIDLRRLIVRHRHVAPMVSMLLAATDARVRILDADGRVVVDRQSETAEGEPARHPITVERGIVGWVEGDRRAGAVAAVLSYAAAREADKRSLAQEALDRYRELTLIYDLAQRIGERLEVGAVARVALAEVGRIAGDGSPFLLLAERDGRLASPVAGDGSLEEAAPDAGIVGAVAHGDADIVNDVAADSRATPAERAFASLIAAPLVVRGERLGVVGAATVEPHVFRAGDLKVLQAVAALTGPAIAQARVTGR